MAPIDAVATPDGNILLGEGTYRVVPVSERPLYPGRLHTNHFVSCIHADTHHKAKS